MTLIVVSAIFSWFTRRHDVILAHAAFSIFIMTLSLPLALYRRQLDWFDPLVFTVIWTGLIRTALPALPVVTLGMDSHPADPSAGPAEVMYAVARAFLLSSLWYFALYLGYLLGRSRGGGPGVVAELPPAGRYGMAPSWPRVLVVAAASLVAFAVYAEAAGGFSGLLLQRGLPRSMRLTALVGGHLAPIVRLLTYAMLLVYAMKPGTVKHPLFLPLSALALVIGFATSGSRSFLILTGLTFLIIWSIHNRRLSITRIIVLGMISIALLGALGQFRSASFRYARQGELSKAIEYARDQNAIASGIETVISYATRANGLYGILLRSEDVPLLMGESYASVLAMPIPRAVWPGKPDAGGVLTARLVFNRNDTAIPPGNVGEAFLNFHIPGIVVIPLIFGIVLAWLSRLYKARYAQPLFIVLYAISLLRLQPNSEGLYSWSHAVVATLLAALILGLRWRAPARKVVQKRPVDAWGAR